MSGDITSAILYLIDALSKAGLVDKKTLAQLLESLDKNIFICGQQKLDYNMIAESLKKGPVTLECERKRAHQISKRVAEILKKRVYKVKIGRKIQPVYMLFTREQAEDIVKMASSEDAPECLKNAIQELLSGGSGKQKSGAVVKCGEQS